MQHDAVLGPLSLLMKGEIVPPASRWHGIPTVRMGADFGFRVNARAAVAFQRLIQIGVIPGRRGAVNPRTHNHRPSQ